MVDLEDVLSSLHRFKTNLKSCIKFIEKLEKLFANIDAGNDLGAESIGNGSIEDLIKSINDILIFNK